MLRAETTMGTPRDYQLTGPESARAVERGLAGADWYHSPVDREAMLDIMKRSNARAAADTILWLALTVLAGWWVVVSWVSWWTIPAMFVYGTLYGSASDARWHECGHRTAFRSKAANLIVYHIASFMDVREPVSWRWSHNRHHADTIIVGRDPEIAYQRPIRFWRVFADMFGILSTRAEFAKYAANVLGRLTPAEADYVPPREAKRAIFWGRVHTTIWLVTIATSIITTSLLPLVLVGLPSLYGRWLLVVFGTTQHAGLAEDVLDHRLNTRSVHMNPILRFLYLNMNYHREHHMFPSVPYRNLPKLHALVRDDLPAPHRGVIHAYRDILPALWRQRRDLDHFIQTQIPSTSA
jgi:fatty acid desaturase